MKVPWHIWVVGVLSLLWNGFGALDYALTQFDVTAYTANMPEEMRALLETYPTWMDAVWALAVWLPVLGALLLLGTRRAAAPVFGLGLIFVLAAGLYNYVLAETKLYEVAGPYVLVFWLIVVLIGLLQWMYARAMAKRGVLE